MASSDSRRSSDFIFTASKNRNAVVPGDIYQFLGKFDLLVKCRLAELDRVFPR
jgi:hypothetical protein